MTVKDLVMEVSAAAKVSQANRHRFMVILCSKELNERLMRLAKKIYEKYLEETKSKENLLITGRSQFLELAEKFFKGKFVHYKDSQSVLGETYSSLLLDFTEGFHPNDLGIIVETIAEGGMIIAFSPPLNVWENFRSRWHEELVSEPYGVEDIVGRFYRRFMQKTLKAEGITVFDADRRKILKKFERGKSSGREEIVIPEEGEIDKKIYNLCATQDQVRVVQVFERFFERQKQRKAIVITADRGRGKTAVLGIVTPYIVSKINNMMKRPARILVVAPTLQAVQTYFKFLLKSFARCGLEKFYVKESDGMVTVVNSKFARVEYAVPRRAMQEKDLADVVIVDEAAGIDVPVLWKIAEGARYIIFSTTIHGYEGTGRGFAIRFLKRLESGEDFEVVKIHMEEPIRYGKGDPIEKWLNDVLLLDAQPAEIEDKDFDAVKSGNLEFRQLDKEKLVEDDKLLREFFGIYVLAHYRNRPSDLMILLDMPNHLPFAVFVNDKIVCSLHVAIEGNLDEETIEKIKEGYKPKGQIIPDLVLKHFWNFDFPKMVGARIVRIATHPDLMKMGIGSFALKKIVELCESKNLDWVGSGFGVSPELLRFWIKNGFKPIHITPQRNEISGEHSVIVLKALKLHVEDILSNLNSEFVRRLLEYLADELRDLETETALMLLESLMKDIDFQAPNFGEVERRRMSKYFQGASLYEYTSDLIRPLVKYYFSKKDKVDLSFDEKIALVAKCLQLKDWKDLGEKRYKLVLNAVKNLWRWFYGEGKLRS